VVDLDKLMQGIRGEIRANRKEDGKRHLAVVSVPGNGHLAYSVKELLKLSDVDFVRGAYLTLLGREVDPTGLSSNLESLRIGRSDRLSVLHALSQSEEARRYAAPVVLPPLPPRRPLRNRLDPRKLIQRFFGIRQLVKTGDQLKADLKRRLMGAEAAVGDLG